MKRILMFCLIAVTFFAIANMANARVLEVRRPGGIGTLGEVYPTIQAAIDAASPGDTIAVHSGTYKELITINKAITLQGDGRDTTIIDGVDGTGTDVTVVYITAPGNVTFSGFTVKNAAIVNTGDLRFGILTNSSVSGVTYTISANKVIGTNNPDAEQDYGIYGRNSGKENLIITNNIVTQTGANNIVVETHQGTTDISYNTLDAGCYGSDPIFVMTLDGVNVSNLQKVSHNNIDMSTGSARATGVSFATGVTTGVGGQFTNIQITENNIFNLKADRRGIGFWNNDAGDGSAGNMIAPQVSGNIITGAGGVVTASMGIDTIGLVTDANISNNTVTGLDYSYKERAWNDHIAAGTMLNRNCFSNNSSGVLTERTSGTLNAERNSWGDATGPYHPVINPGGLGDKVSDNVSFYPWYTDCSYGSPAYMPVRNVTLGAYYSKIQPAIDAARNGDLITADAGTYVEVVNIDKSVTLQGASGAIIKPDNTTPLLDGGVRRVALYVNSVSNVTIEGFEIDGTGGDVHIGIYGLNSNNCIIKNNVIHDIKNAIEAPVGDVAGVGIMLFGWGQGIDNGLIQGNTVYNTGRMGIWAGGMNSSTYDFLISSNNVIKNNIVHNAWQGPTNDGGGAIQINGAKDSSYINNTVYATDSNWFGIYSCGSSTGNTITGNDVYNNKYGIVCWNNVTFVEFGASTPAAPVAYCNKIHGNTTLGFRNVDTDPAYMVNAEKNWWGNASGPGGAGGGSGDKVSANVDFFPWLLSEDCDNTTLVAPDYVVDDDWTGLPDWSMVTVEGTNYFIGLNAFDTIQEAVNAAVDGNSIRVLAGQYAGAAVNEDLLIVGDSAGGSVITSGPHYGGGAPGLQTAFKLDSGASGAEIRNFTIDCNSATNFYFAIFSRAADNVVVDSLTINYPVQGITNYGGSNWQITNNAINYTGAASGGGIAILLGAYPPTYTTLQGNLVKGNTIIASGTAPDFSCPGILMSLDLRYGRYAQLTGNEDISCNQIVNNIITGTDAASEVGIEIGVIGLEDDPNKIAATIDIIQDNLVRDNVIKNTDWGVYFYTVSDLMVLGNKIIDCNDGIHIEDSHKCSLINFNSIYGSKSFGVNNTGNVVVDASYNWWGHISGPNDPVGTKETDGKTCYDVSTVKNADGLGDGVTDKVIYCAWLTVPPIASNSSCPAGDLDGDCDVDFLDLAILANNWLNGVEE